MIKKGLPLLVFLLCIISAVISGCGEGKQTLIYDAKDEAGKDMMPPVAVSSIPANGAQDVALDTTISITFSEEMDASTINDSTFKVMAAGNDSTVSGTIAYKDKTAVFTPSAPLNTKTIYQITISKNIRDIAGNTMPSDESFSFMTLDNESNKTDSTPPVVLWHSPANAETDVAVNAKIAVVFSDGIDASTINNNSFRVNLNGDNIPGILSYTDKTATFKPMTNLALNAIYMVTVTRDIRDAAGNAMSDDKIFSFVTRDGSWSAPTSVQAGSLDMLYYKAAFNSSGNAVAVWYKKDNGLYNVWANTYSGGQWGDMQLLETDDSGDAKNPRVAIDKDGNAIAVWQQSDGSRFNIMANRYVAGSGWVGAEKIETDDNGNAENPQLVIDSTGIATAIWQQNDGTGTHNIMVNRYDPVSKWGQAKAIDAGSGDALNPQLAVSSNGDITVVWQQHNGAKLVIMANSYAGSEWGKAETVEKTGSGGGSEYPAVAVDSSGYAIAVWQQYDGTRYNIWSNRFTPGAGWNAELNIETEDEGDAKYPQVAIDTSGNAIAVWQQHDGTRYNIWSNRFTPAKWGTATRIEEDDSGDAIYPQIAIDSYGNAAAIWYLWDNTSSSYSIWTNNFK